jgi:flagellar biosynthesis/type III secretory pathway M-ring protein FliF/YscJ
VLIVAIVLFLAWRSHKKAVIARYPVAIPLPSADPDDRGLPAGRRSTDDDETKSLDGLNNELEALLAGPQVDPRRETLQGQIGELIDRQPDDVAHVLRTWMAER